VVPPFSAVFFDFAGTLWSDRALREVHLRQLRFVAEAAGVDASDEELRAAYRSGMGVAYREVATQPAYLHRTLFATAFRSTAVALGGEIDAATADQAVDRQYAATVDAAVLRPDALETLRELRRQSLHVQVVSNIDDEQLEPMLDRLGLRDVISAATSSEAARSCKPDPGIYRTALAKSDCEPARVLFVGDSLRHDVEGPTAMGMRSAWLAIDASAGRGEANPDFVIEALGEVLGIVGAEVAGR
jgi:HAD superfamily hydrolase (TIGR01509 family)